ncbi:MAG: permease, partial [Actinobacteria bacterium]|nr:permease [Actinomycetota bacterium]
MGFWGTVGDSFAEGWWMFYDTLWALVLGFGLSGAVQAFVSKGEMQRVLGDHRPRTVARSTFFGMVSSSCSYAASALSKSLFARGADFTSSMVFMFASTNLVVELGIVLWLLIGWQFALAEFVGGAIMIAILAVVLPRVVNVPELDAARQRLRAGKAGSDDGHEGHAAMAEEQHTAKPWRERIRSRAGWSDASGYTISDVTMLRKELVIGYVIAGFAAIAVPVSVWEAVFLSGHGFWSVLENVIVGPVIAFISFVCSVGNVPLAAALWKGGISFGGVIAFIFADLLALPLVLIYRKFYGTRLAVKLSLVFWATMSLAGLLTEGIFQLARLIPTERRDEIAVIHFGWNYTTVLNALAVAAFGYLYWLYKNAARFGGGQGYAKDVVCGMQVRTADAPARAMHEGQTFYFCSDKCSHKFDGAPAKYATGTAVEA